jgi:hypothetical protein
MSTWHQDQRKHVIPYDKWTIVTNPPHGLRTFWTFDTESEARKRLETWRMNGHGAHSHIIAPTAGAGVLL